MRPSRTPAAAAAVCVALTCALTGTDVRAQSPEAEVVETIEAFHSALAAGDSVTALSLLSDEVVILESGNVETKEQYRSGHIHGDMRFAQAVPSERGEVDVSLAGDVAWAWSTSSRVGRMGDREIDSTGAELMVLRRVDARWLIEAIHWSSRSR